MDLLLLLLASKPVFRNHLFICACAFILAGLTDKKQEPWLLYWQLSLLYFGALLNKIWQMDWWNGQFMHNWLINARESNIYIRLHDLFPGHLMDHVFSLGSMTIEFSIAVLLLFKKRHLAAVWTIVLFHTCLYTITGFRFGHFFEDIVILMLIFLFIPEGDIQISMTGPKNRFPKALLRLMNWNRQFLISSEKPEEGHWLMISYSDRKELDARAIGSLLLYSPATYFLILAFDTSVRAFFNVRAEHLITALWLWGGILFFAWVNTGLKFKGPSGSPNRTFPNFNLPKD
jgi:hypothetical protein